MICHFDGSYDNRGSKRNEALEAMDGKHTWLSEWDGCGGFAGIHFSPTNNDILMTDWGRAVYHVLKMQTDSLVHAKAINCLAVASQQSNLSTKEKIV